MKCLRPQKISCERKLYWEIVIVRQSSSFPFWNEGFEPELALVVLGLETRN
jgi:hypothetical protein